MRRAHFCFVSLLFAAVISPALVTAQQYMKPAAVDPNDFDQLVKSHQLLKCIASAQVPYPKLEKLPAASKNMMAGAAHGAGACYRDIDRSQEMSPPPLVLRAGTRVFVRISNLRPDETLVAAVSYSKLAPPSPGNDFVKNAVNPLQTIALTPTVHIAARVTLPKICDTTDAAFDFEKCQTGVVNVLNSSQVSINRANAALTCLESYQVPVVTPIPETLPIPPTISNYTCSAALPIGAITDPKKPDENSFATQRTAVDKVIQEALDLEVPVSALNQLDSYLTTNKNAPTEYFSNQARLKSLATQIQSAQVTLQQSDLLMMSLALTPPAQILYFDVPSLTTVTATITGTEVISKTTNTVATWTTSSTSYKVVISAGLGFSNLVYRTFANTPQVQNGVPVVNGSGNTLSIVTETDSRLSVMAPEVMGSLVIPGLRKFDRCSFGCSFLVSGGIGANLTTKTADFDTGFSLRLSDVIFTPAVHFGREARLTDGITVGSQLGANAPSTLPTQNKWIRRFGFVITYVIPLS